MANFGIIHSNPNPNSLSFSVVDSIDGYSDGDFTVAFRSSFNEAVFSDSEIQSIRLFPEGDENNHIFYTLTGTATAIGPFTPGDTSFDIPGVTAISGGPGDSEASIDFDFSGNTYFSRSVLEIDFSLDQPDDPSRYPMNDIQLVIMRTVAGSTETITASLGQIRASNDGSPLNTAQFAAGVLLVGTRPEVMRIRELFNINRVGNSLIFTEVATDDSTLSGTIVVRSSPQITRVGVQTANGSGGPFTGLVRVVADGTFYDIPVPRLTNGTPSPNDIAAAFRAAINGGDGDAPLLRQEFNVSGTGTNVTLTSINRGARQITAFAVYGSLQINPAIDPGAIPGVNIVRAEFVARGSGRTLAVFVPRPIADPNQHQLGGHYNRGRAGGDRMQATSRGHNTEFLRVNHNARFTVPRGVAGQVNPRNPRKR